MDVAVEDYKAYQAELRVLARNLHLKCVDFVDVPAMLGNDSSYHSWTLEQIREKLWTYGDEQQRNWTSSDSYNESELRTYLGYKKFLDIDLQTSARFSGLSRSMRKKQNAKVAREMIRRGYVCEILYVCMHALVIHASRFIVLFRANCPSVSILCPPINSCLQ